MKNKLNKNTFSDYPLTIHEHEKTYPEYITERHLQCIWYDPALRPTELITSKGEKVIVKNPGEWNLGPGPDFIRAHLIVSPPKRELYGDVEIHMHPNDWALHKHYSNPLYKNVIAHVTYFPFTSNTRMLDSSTIEISLNRILTSNPSFSPSDIDITSYPYHSKLSNSPPCQDIFSSLNITTINSFLESAGKERLRRKTLALSHFIKVDGIDTVLYQEILAALGYKQNSINFRRLARIVPLPILAKKANGDPVVAYAILLGVAGLLPKNIQTCWDKETTAFIRKLWDIWWRHSDYWENNTMRKDTWKFSEMRPQNHPVRRLAAAASIFCEPEKITRLVSNDQIKDWNKWLSLIFSLFQNIDDFPYWNKRLSWGGKIMEKNIALIGKERIIAIIVNLLLPVLSVSKKVDIYPFINTIPPEQGNAILRKMTHHLFGRDYPDSVLSTTLRQQGLLQIFYDFCINARNCDECKLPKLKHLQ